VRSIYSAAYRFAHDGEVRSQLRAEEAAQRVASLYISRELRAERERDGEPQASPRPGLSVQTQQPCVRECEQFWRYSRPVTAKRQLPRRASPNRKEILVQDGSEQHR